MPICKMCGNENLKLIRCHIYPESMSKEVSGVPHCLVSMIAGGDQPIANYAHGGIYDKKIICSSCESLFKDADDYAINFRRSVLKNTIPAKLLLQTVRFPSYEASPEKLHRFAMQTWLRSHFSERYEHQQINSPELAKEISALITNKKETISTGIAVCFLFFTSDLPQVMMSPVAYKEVDFPLYSMWMPNMNVLIASSDRGLPPGFSDIQLQQGQPVTVLRTSQMFTPMLETIVNGVTPYYDKLSIMFDAYDRQNSIKND